MTTDDLRTRAREAAKKRGQPHHWTAYENGYIDGFLAHAAQQPSRDAIQDELAHWLIGYGYESASVSIDDAGDMADAILALLNGPVS